MDFDFALSTSWSDIDISSKSAWASELESRGYDVALITPAESVPEDAASAVFRLPELTTDKQVDFSDVEERYQIPSLRHLQATEREYFALTRGEARERTRRLLTALERIFDEHRFDYCLQGRGGELHRLLLHYYVKAIGGTPIWHGFSFFDDTFSLQTNLDGEWDTYETIPYRELPDDGREWAETFLMEFRERRKFFSLTGDDDKGGSGVLKRMSKVLGTLDERLLRRKHPGTRRRIAKRALIQTANAEINQRLARSVESSTYLCDSEQYVLYPVQFPAESRLTVFSPQFHNQRALIEYIAGTLPAGLKLFIKPHPHHPGVQSPLWIYRFVRHPDVEVLHPDVHSHDAIEGASAVVSVNNTPGFESILYGTPLLNLGKAFYSGTPSAKSLEPLSDLSEALAEAVNCEIPEKRIIESVYSLRKACYEGDAESSSSDDAAVCIDSLLEFCNTIDG